MHIIDNGVVGSLSKDKTKTDSSSQHKQILSVPPEMLEIAQQIFNHSSVVILSTWIILSNFILAAFATERVE